MALNDKLINYEDISTFHSNLLNDSSVSNKATWSSEKIASEIQQGIGASIDDNDVSAGKTWSSQKISEALVSLEKRIAALEHPSNS